VLKRCDPDRRQKSYLPFRAQDPATLVRFLGMQRRTAPYHGLIALWLPPLGAADRLCGSAVALMMPKQSNA
jgi:hypothetical protein